MIYIHGIRIDIIRKNNNKLNTLKMKKFKLRLLFLVLVSFSISSCLDDNIEDINNTSFAGFTFKTTKEFKVSISALNNENKAIKGVFIKLYTKNPFTSDGALIENSEDFLVYKGLTNNDGLLLTKIAPATTVDSLSILVNYIGLPNYKSIKLDSSDINLVIGGSGPASSNVASKISKVASATIPPTAWTSNNEFLVLGGWNNAGVPKNLIANDVITSDFLSDVNASLPERIELPTSHPEYFATDDDGSIVLEKDAEVWVTFVHEGAGYFNSLAYYTHPNGLPPTVKTDIKDQTIIFPNTSFSGSGGGLTSGNKVQLFYYNPTTQLFTNIFPAGTTVCWILRSNAWSNLTVGKGYFTFYSDARFNPESTTARRKHNVVLKDVARELFLLGFEDLNRDQSSDNDFNDAVFYATVSPYNAVKSTLYKSIDSVQDKDNDGVPDASDEYPEDPKRAFNNYYPAKNQVGTLAFEDLWPYKGDYDFNDLIVDYSFNQITNAQNQIIEIDAQLTVRAIGASYKNGFGIELNTTPDNILSVSGQKITENILNIDTNGTEKDQDNAVIIAFDNAFSVTPHPGNGMNVNTVVGETYIKPGVINLNIIFKNAISFNQLGTAPFNPFIFINGVRSKEVHLPGSTPTNLADKNLLGTGNDNSDEKTGKYYMSDKYLPWAINIPTKFDYPLEKENITKAYYNFNKWASSKGFNYMDWYLNYNGYRDSKIIFTK